MNTETNHAISNAKGWFETIEQLMQRLETANEQAQEGPDETEAVRREIEESPLSVSVRDGWHAPGQMPDDGPDEYEILLSTGGPALRIYGRLDEHAQPQSAELQWQDWGTKWERYPAAEDTLLRFAGCFWFGE